MITLQQFRVLLAIRDQGSLTRAAAELHYGVPTVAHHLNTLERHLQLRLVDRERSGAQLTPLGLEFAGEAEQILARVDQAERLVADRRDAGVATLRVGTFASIGSRLLPAAIGELQRRSPVRVEVVEAEPTEVVRLLRGGEVHAGLIYDFADDPAFVSDDLALTPLLQEPYRVMVANDSEYAQRDELDFAELSEVAWVCSRNADEASDRLLRRVCHSVGYEVRELMRSDDLNMIHGLVAAGLGFGLSTSAAVDPRFGVVLLPAVQDLGERHVSFATRLGAAPKAAHWLGEILQRRVLSL